MNLKILSVISNLMNIYNLNKWKPNFVDHGEAIRIAESVQQLELEHVVITSVDRDDLIDGGAMHFINVIDSIKSLNPKCTIEILTPDFKGYKPSLDKVFSSRPDMDPIYDDGASSRTPVWKRIKKLGWKLFHLTLRKFTTFPNIGIPWISKSISSPIAKPSRAANLSSRDISAGWSPSSL